MSCCSHQALFLLLIPHSPNQDPGKMLLPDALVSHRLRINGQVVLLDQPLKEQPGLLAQIQMAVSRRAAHIDLMSSVFALAEIGLDSDSFGILAKHPELGFFEKDSLANLLVKDMEGFRDGLPKGELPWTLTTIAVVVREQSRGGESAMGQSKYERLCFLKGDLVSEYKYKSKHEMKTKPRPTTEPSSERPGVLILWLDETPDARVQVRDGKRKEPVGARGSGEGVVASVSIYFMGCDKGEFRVRSKVIRVKQKGNLKWELSR